MTTPPPPPPPPPRRRPGQSRAPGPEPPQGPQPKPRRRPSLRGEHPTETIPLRGSLRGTPYRDPRVTRAVAEEQSAARALDLALRVAEVMLRCGSSAGAVEAATVAVGVVAGLEDMDVDLTMQSMHMQCRTPSGQIISRLRVVRQPRRDFGRLAAVHALVDDLVSGEIDIEQAEVTLKEINHTPRMWSRWMITLSEGGVAAGVALMLGASVGGLALAMVAAVAIGAASKLVGRLNLPDFYHEALGGAVATIVSFLGFAFIPGVSGPDFAYAVAGGIVFLLPSLTLTSAMEDILSGFPVTGTARLLEVLVHTFGLIVGVGGGLGVCLQLATTLELGLQPPPLDQLSWASAALPLVIFGAAFIGLAGAMSMQNHYRMLLHAGALSAVGVAAAAAFGEIGIGRVSATGLSAVIIGFLARMIALRKDAPALTLQVPATFGLLPGLSIFMGLYHMVDPEALTNDALSSQGMIEVLTALGIIMAIATGATLGDRLAAPFDGPVAQRRRDAVASEGERRSDDEEEDV